MGSSRADDLRMRLREEDKETDRQQAGRLSDDPLKGFLWLTSWLTDRPVDRKGDRQVIRCSSSLLSPSFVEIQL